MAHSIKVAPLLGLATLAALGVVSRPAHASTVISSSGIDIQSPPPTTVVRPADASTSEIIGFQEQQDVTLASNLEVNINTDGFYSSSFPPLANGGAIARGTAVDSFFLQADPGVNTHTNYQGTITFAQQILGIDVGNVKLDNTDTLLGSPTTTYDKSALRGLEFGGGPESDTIDLSGDTVTLNLNTSTSVDDIRIITAASPTPEPSQVGMLALMGLGLGGLLLRARKRQGAL